MLVEAVSSIPDGPLRFFIEFKFVSVFILSRESYENTPELPLFSEYLENSIVQI